MRYFVVYRYVAGGTLWSQPERICNGEVDYPSICNLQDIRAVERLIADGHRKREGDSLFCCRITLQTWRPFENQEDEP